MNSNMHEREMMMGRFFGFSYLLIITTLRWFVTWSNLIGQTRHAEQTAAGSRVCDDD
jgi:hypothetical protein